MLNQAPARTDACLTPVQMESVFKEIVLSPDETNVAVDMLRALGEPVNHVAYRPFHAEFYGGVLLAPLENMRAYCTDDFRFVTTERWTTALRLAEMILNARDKK
jgi:hypothetical protein